MPRQATRSGLPAAPHFLSGVFQVAPIDSTAACAMRSSVSQSPPLDADAADALAVDEDRAAAFHRGPAVRPRREREAERVRHVEGLPVRALHRRRALVRRGADRLGGRRVHGVEAPAVHALEQDEIAAGVGDRAVMAISACSACSMAVAIIFLAPSCVRRLVSAMYINLARCQ